MVYMPCSEVSLKGVCWFFTHMRIHVAAFRNDFPPFSLMAEPPHHSQQSPQDGERYFAVGLVTSMHISRVTFAIITKTTCVTLKLAQFLIGSLILKCMVIFEQNLT